MADEILLCPDVARTLPSNGPQPEWPQAREPLRMLAGRQEVTPAYVSGRRNGLLRRAIEEFGLPQSDYAIGEVGTAIYETGDGEGRPWVSV